LVVGITHKYIAACIHRHTVGVEKSRADREGRAVSALGVWALLDRAAAGIVKEHITGRIQRNAARANSARDNDVRITTLKTTPPDRRETNIVSSARSRKNLFSIPSPFEANASTVFAPSKWWHLLEEAMAKYENGVGSQGEVGEP